MKKPSKLKSTKNGALDALDTSTQKRRGRPAGSKDSKPRLRTARLIPHVDERGRPLTFKSAWDYAMWLLNNEKASPVLKAKIAASMLPYERPRLAEKPLGKKEEKWKAAQTAGQSGEFDGLMEPPKAPRLVVRNDKPEGC